MGLLDPNIDEENLKANKMTMFELNQAKSSDIPHEPASSRNP